MPLTPGQFLAILTPQLMAMVGMTLHTFFTQWISRKIITPVIGQVAFDSVPKKRFKKIS
jgi:hypothetical protein